MEIAEFHRHAEEAVAALPEHLREKLTDVVIVVEDRPRRGGKNLLGLYEGVPLTEWGRDYSGKLTDKITLYREAIEREAGAEEEVPHVIRETVWHEVGHYFGLDHDKIDLMEERWREMRS